MNISKYYVNLIHILFSGPLLVYVGLKKPDNKYLYYFLLILGILLAVLFLYRLITIKPFSSRHIFFIAHLVIYSPLLIYLGLYHNKSSKFSFDLALVIGLLAILYHAIRLLQKLNIF